MLALGVAAGPGSPVGSAGAAGSGRGGSSSDEESSVPELEPELDELDEEESELSLVSGLAWEASPPLAGAASSALPPAAVIPETLG